MNCSNYKQYRLQKYDGISSRHTCPQCGGKRCFTLYVDEAGEPLADYVGRCDHESGCGYHYTPRDYFAANPTVTKYVTDAERVAARIKATAQATRPLDTIPIEYVRRSVRHDRYNDLLVFLNSLFDEGDVARLVEDYQIGTTKTGNAIFFQIDVKGRVRTGKIMQYDSRTGHRVKDADGCGRFDWVHAVLKRGGVLPAEWTLTQCLFGEHLLTKYPDRDVRVVESEKTAIICAGMIPRYVWIATGGKSQLNGRLDVLRGRNVILYPDVDGFADWSEKAKELKGLHVTVSDYLERNATDVDRLNKIDIADLLIAWRRRGGVVTSVPQRSDYADIDAATFEILRSRVDSTQIAQALELARDFDLVVETVNRRGGRPYYNSLN